MAEKFKSFSDFYPFYLSEHSNKTCRLLHFCGSLLVIIILLMSIYHANYANLILLPVVGYGFAWVGHFVFEKNKPATFQYPMYSLIGDWVMFFDILIGKIKIF